MTLNKLLIPALVLLLSACSTSKPSRYSIDQDHGPIAEVDLSRVADAVPTDEAKSWVGNKSPYVVWGKEYSVLDSSDGYLQRGTASWYGKKFHGHQTANGEVYDMYAMSAAHKSLPLPSFVRVTNLDNGKQVVVRVNDRGPFHGARLIDLSYAAAYRLDMLKQGTARVELEALSGVAQGPATARLISSPAVQKAVISKPARFIQLGAFSSFNAAQRVKTRVALLLREQRIDISKSSTVPVLYRVRMGPLDDSQTFLNGLLAQLATEGFGDAQVLDLP
ncbi:MAG: septal ring lytic transglycosylase RlpA family protein [Motiliproteus sp.]